MGLKQIRNITFSYAYISCCLIYILSLNNVDVWFSFHFINIHVRRIMFYQLIVLYYIMFYQLIVLYYIIHLLDSAEPDIRFVVQIKADVGRSEAESNISLDLHNKSNVRRGSVQQMFYYAEITE